MDVEEKKKSKKKKKKNEEEKGPVSKKKMKKEKKAYDLPGQKRDPPEERDPLRIFYESLYDQSPGCEMAQFWMMESGLLQLEVAKKVYEKKQKKSRLNSPIKTIKSVAVKKNAESLESKTVLKQSKKRKLAAEDR